jgi:cardiolipin synthase
VGGSRKAARRVRSWTATPLGRTIIGIGALVGLLILVFALIGVPLIFRGTPVNSVHLDGIATHVRGSAAGFRASAELATETPLEPDVTVEILNNGNGTFPRLWDDLRSASRSIMIVNYYASAGMLADTLAAILAARVRGGVIVHYVYDPVGSGALAEGWLDGLRTSGVRVAEFRPLRWYRLDRANHRTHVRSIVIDGRVAYTGGYGFDDRWRGDGRSPDQWRDMNVRLTGPAVDRLQAVFVAHWAEAAGELLASASLVESGDSVVRAPMPVPRDSAAGPEEDSDIGLVGVLHSQTGLGSSRAERALAFSIAIAARTLYIANAYFVPDDDLVRLLCDAVGRGVDVRVLTNGEKGDVPMAWLAGRHRYAALLECGVRVFEYAPTVLHSKALVTDGMWAMIGTINFDNRSLVFNDEVSMLALDRHVGAQMDSLFQADLELATEILADAFEARGLWQRVRERVADLASRWL